MTNSFPYLLGCLLVGIFLIVFLTVKWKIPAFFALLIAALLVGAAVQMPIADVLSNIKDGFGNIMKSLGLIIVMGTTLGTVLEHNGSISVMSDFIIKKMGQKNIALSMNVIGFIVGMPVFCDSGFIILSSLNKSIAQRTGISILTTSVSLATGLLSVHCLIPPHPGASAAATLLDVDFGKLLLFGIIIAMPVSLIGFLWSIYSGKKNEFIASNETFEGNGNSQAPSVFQSFLPIILPVILMATRSVATFDKSASPLLSKTLFVIGEPVVALGIGVLLALLSWKGKNKNMMSKLLAEGAEKAGSILIIIGAGGSFGAILAAMHFGEHFSKALPLASMGILFPFLITSLLKTAQGSSTVAIITASSILLPLLPALHLDSANGRLLCVLSMGAGSMIVSHANDAYFWVIAKFSSIETRPMFRSYTIATLLMGVVAFGVVCILSLLLPH